MTTVCPSMVIGPPMVNGGFTTGKVVAMLMNNKMPGGIPKMAFSPVDVREVADAHINCIKLNEAQGKRFIIAGKSMWMREMADILHGQWSKHGYDIPQEDANYWLVRFVGLFRADAARITDFWGKEAICDNSRSKEVLGI